MSKEKQIEGIIEAMGKSCASCFGYGEAELIYNAGYRKQSEGEWIATGIFELDNIYSGWKCSVCGYIFCWNKTNYCPNCGARMRKEDEGK